MQARIKLRPCSGKKRSGSSLTVVKIRNNPSQLIYTGMRKECGPASEAG